jgi:cold shock CspA family protein
MRGKIVNINADRGFCFLRMAGQREHVFAHVKDFDAAGITWPPQEHDEFIFELGPGRDGRSRAYKLVPVDKSDELDQKAAEIEAAWASREVGR